ncbi:MaoC family dehydratase N-terminal domain-containing protein [Conexibacter stalactiti]|uniref:MaoC family dehydratase N-terminal domain-containing protein n=1 Tax=Conexibacter stalactiti TaxID=1940611 RepID=A0ABU4HRQ0_9ACTN|nr:MaoC family dehydratase N-terminal domain-containing protein [Conexibacter stalactiti]MDW5595992.1 MaoC family dehydratase N-terminal domain-containing protein [Conexibacter stalactiti]MEC5036634.1 MaoC family dehydratase N-terminal domain-containing protein [Conexibacter stalactiti]
MPANTDAVGKRYTPVVYAVGREKVKEYALAVGETDPLHLDVAAARAAGFADVVAPPMFAVVYQSPSVMPALFDPEVGIDFSMMVHSGQDFRWERLVVAGEELTTTTSVAAVSEKGGLGFFDFEVVTVDEAGEPVVTGIWKMLVRGA